MFRNPSRPRLSLESLEARQMMAGDVDAYAIGKILYITGDSAGNGIALVGGPNGTLNVMGIEQDGSATTVNGQASQEFTRIKDVVISMERGNDAVVITNIALNGNLYVAGGRENDVVALGNFADDGLIDDAVDTLLGAVTVKKSLIIDTSDGDDRVLAADLTVSKTLLVSTGNGDDQVTFTTAGLGGAGVTALKATTINTLNGNDQVILEGFTAGKSLSINTGNDNDIVQLQDVSVSSNLTVSTGNGDDEVDCEDVTAKNLTVNLGANDDELVLLGTTIGKKSKLDGGRGVNELVDVGGNSLGKAKVVNFTPVRV